MLLECKGNLRYENYKEFSKKIDISRGNVPQFQVLEWQCCNASGKHAAHCIVVAVICSPLFNFLSQCQ
jgi:hypothetical protein